jgi:nitrite reductase (NADH) small subunit
MSKYQYFGKITELQEGHFTIRTVGRHAVGGTLLKGRPVLVRNYCPHAGAPICQGRIAPDFTALNDHITPDDCPLVLRCPWHGWEFDLETGHARFPSPLKLAFLDYKIEAEDVYVFV